jgi:hypothetical protein
MPHADAKAVVDGIEANRKAGDRHIGAHAVDQVGVAVWGKLDGQTKGRTVSIPAPALIQNAGAAITSAARASGLEQGNVTLTTVGGARGRLRRAPRPSVLTARTAPGVGARISGGIHK